jgi:hypothetical protein
VLPKKKRLYNYKGSLDLEKLLPFIHSFIYH